MNIQEIKNNIDRIIGTDGDLHIPSFWMNKLLNEIVDLIPDEPSEPSEPTVPEESVKNDIVAFTFGSAMVKVDLTNNVVLTNSSTSADAINYDSASNSISTFYNGTHGNPLEIWEQNSIEPFYYGTLYDDLFPADAEPHNSPVNYFHAGIWPDGIVYVKLNGNLYKLSYTTNSRG